MADRRYPPNWPELRLQQRELDDNRCKTCGITAEQLEELGWPGLQVHHCNEGPPKYNGPYWREIVGKNVVTLCAYCHDGITNSVRHQQNLLDPKKQPSFDVQPESKQVTPRITREPAVLEITVTESTSTRGAYIPSRQSQIL